MEKVHKRVRLIDNPLKKEKKIKKKKLIPIK